MLARRGRTHSVVLVDVLGCTKRRVLDYAMMFGCVGLGGVRSSELLTASLHLGTGLGELPLRWLAGTVISMDGGSRLKGVNSLKSSEDFWGPVRWHSRLDPFPYSEPLTNIASYFGACGISDEISGKRRKEVNKQASKQKGLSPNPLDVPSGVAKLRAPEFYLVGVRMCEAYATRLGSVHLPGNARQTHVRRSRHLLFTTRRSRAVESP
ncbi:hypothetical protein CRG98_005493 [Punica granatum]|uniref:Uncharacterized protein n=1 Tax=Punica granatum TaxID=22663 RepID=A0A2I0L053_PUNGR|nr:hypothetical protein CRG98_005493 [Punica granatum]